MDMRISDQELAELAKDLESDRVERKASLADPNKIRQAICAFANDMPNHQEPGVIIIGVNDDGSCAKLGITDELLRTLSDMRSDGNILPFPVMTVEKRMAPGCEIAIVAVQPSYSPPVRFNGRVWIRVGPRRATATAEEEIRLAEKRRATDLPFDLHPRPSATLEDLDLEHFTRKYLRAAVPPEVLAENQRSTIQQLGSLRFATLDTPPLPTNLGLLVTGYEPTRFLPGAYIQFLRIEGETLTDPIKDQKEIKGPLYDCLHLLDDVFRAHINIATDIRSQSLEQRRPDYPISALQQIARNAVMHRTYEGTHAPVRITWFSDRIEILNPGGPFGQVNVRNFGQPGVADYRNPNLAEAMKNLGFVQRFGIGIQLARQEMELNGNPPIEFDADDARVRVVLKKAI